MTAPQIKGWCPGALRPMESGDGLVVRVRVPGGRLTAHQAQSLAALAATHGNGLIDLSARANLQLRGVHNHALLLEGLAALALLDPNPAAEARRNVLTAPFWSPGDDTPALAAALEQALAASDLALPGKFGFAIDTGPAPILAASSADIRLERGPLGLHLRPDGAHHARPVTPAEAIPAALALAHWFLASGGAQNNRGRMAALIASGTPLPAGYIPAPNPTPETPTAGPTAQGWLVGLPLGRITAATLAEIATAPIRLTPWRMLLIENQAPPPLPDLILHPDDPRLRVTACPGAPACPQAHAPVRDLALRLAPRVPKGQTLHLSACAKGCAHPAPADLCLTATPHGFLAARHAKAADAATPIAPDHIANWIAET